MLALIIAACGVQACQNINKTSNDPDSVTSESVDSTQAERSDTVGLGVAATDTASFYTKAAVGGILEVKLGEMAALKGIDSKVKEFGALMVKDHGKANTTLQTIAVSKKIMLPTLLPEKEQMHVDAMGKMTGKDFDKHYIEMMVEDHVKDIELFKKGVSDTDASISKFSKMILPIVEGHHKMAVGIKAVIK